ncbi:MAG: kinase [Cyanobacteria bacterium SW_9_44_58]|nr:MAG: kinase [Cyanobacteria bacterium SW_9_44_58]
MFCHIFIGCPSSGKSSLAATIQENYPDYRIVSTDKIREKLFGDEAIQGNWSEIEPEVFRQIQDHISAGYPVIYDATNAKRPRRMRLLQYLNYYQGVNWLGWYFTTPLGTCLQWNQNRERQVPEEVIKRMAASLKRFPPIAAEGFTTVYSLHPKAKSSLIEQFSNKVSRFSRSLVNRQNRTQNVTRHNYSKLLDFERLMYLIHLLLTYPGIGNLQNSDPKTVKKIIGKGTKFQTALEEICGFMEKIADVVYADSEAIADDLQWLEENGIIGPATLQNDLKLTRKPESDFPTHSYSDREPFQRLIQTIRLIIHEPFIWQKGLGTLDSLVARLKAENLVDYDCRDSLRKDVEKVLKPYGILPKFPMKRGYFAGTAVLSQQELVKVFQLLETEAREFDDPVALQVYNTFKERMETAKFVQSTRYPVRGIHHRKMDSEILSESSLARNTEQVEQAIENGQLLQLESLSDNHPVFCVYPLQIIFYNMNWYLGFERYDGENKGLLGLERLDRLLFNQALSQGRLPLAAGKARSRHAQPKSLNQLITLYQCSGGTYLGNNPKHQQQYLSQDVSQREKVEVTIELWLNDAMFRLVSEGSNGFPRKQMKLSQPFNRELLRGNRSLFSLRKTGDPGFPHRFRLRLPQWSLFDPEFHHWIFGFAGQAKVVSPEALREQLQKTGNAIAQTMSINPEGGKTGCA